MIELLLTACSTAADDCADTTVCEDAVDTLLTARPPVCAEAIPECEFDNPELLSRDPEEVLRLEEGREADCDEGTVDDDSDVRERLVWEEAETDDELLCTPTEDDSTAKEECLLPIERTARRVVLRQGYLRYTQERWLWMKDNLQRGHITCARLATLRRGGLG